MLICFQLVISTLCVNLVDSGPDKVLFTKKGAAHLCCTFFGGTWLRVGCGLAGGFVAQRHGGVETGPDAVQVRIQQLTDALG